MWQFELLNELFKIYLNDESEQAYTAGINAIAAAFRATHGNFMYKNAKGMFKTCGLGQGFPVSIPEAQWHSYIPQELASAGFHRFARWTPPGITTALDHCVAIRIQTPSPVPSFLFLGRNGEGWTDEDCAYLSAIAKIVTDIVSIRYKHDIEIKIRHEAEDALTLIQTRMAAFFETSRDTIYTLDTNELFTSVNMAGVTLFGVESKEDILGKSFSEFTMNPEAHRFFKTKLQDTGFIDDYEIVIKKRDGSLIYCLESAHTVTKLDGTILEIQGSIKDISERIKNERDLWTMNFELLKANQDLKAAQNMIVQQEKLASIGQLAAGVAHEINNPLGFLKSNHTTLKSFSVKLLSLLKTLSETNGDVKTACEKEDLDYFVGESEQIFRENDEGFTRIMDIIHNLMAFSRTSASDKFEPFDVNESIESTLTVARNELKYIADVDKRLGAIPKIEGKQGEISQVILNILVNAAHAIASQKRKEKGRIGIETTEEDGFVLIKISNDGPAIPKEIQNKIFDPFFTTKEPGKGTGLGLSISYDIIVVKHRGALTVASEEGKDTCFTITLPLKHPEHADEGPPLSESPAHGETAQEQQTPVRRTRFP